MIENSDNYKGLQETLEGFAELQKSSKVFFVERKSDEKRLSENKEEAVVSSYTQLSIHQFFNTSKKLQRTSFYIETFFEGKLERTFCPWTR